MDQATAQLLAKALLQIDTAVSPIELDGNRNTVRVSVLSDEVRKALVALSKREPVEPTA